MKNHRFIIENFIHADDAFITRRDILHHITTVLKLHAGEIIIISSGMNDENLFEIKKITREKIFLKKLKESAHIKYWKRTVHLCAAILKRNNFELLVQKAVETGVSRITPIITHRTVKTGLVIARLNTIAREAAEQCGRKDTIQIDEPTFLQDAFALVHPSKNKFFLDVSGKTLSKKIFMKGEPAILFVGPEGGWDEDEKQMAYKNGCTLISLGPTMLRAETAGIIAGYLAAQMEDLGAKSKLHE